MRCTLTTADSLLHRSTVVQLRCRKEPGESVYGGYCLRVAEHSTPLVADNPDPSGRDAEFGRLEAQQHEIQERLGMFRAADRLDRDELHRRPAR